MKCYFCGRSVMFGGSRVQVHAGGKVYGDVPGAAGHLEAATGALKRAYHKKCWLAEQRRNRLQEARDADPSAQQGASPDWREPVSAEVEDIRPREGDRDH